MEDYALLIIRDKHIGTQWERPLSEDQLGIGREKSCGLTLLDRQVSRQHAMIVHREGLYFVKSLGLNGVVAANRDVPKGERRKIEYGDEIRLGAARLRYRRP